MEGKALAVAHSWIGALFSHGENKLRDAHLDEPQRHSAAWMQPVPGLDSFSDVSVRCRSHQKWRSVDLKEWMTGTNVQSMAGGGVRASIFYCVDLNVLFSVTLLSALCPGGTWAPHPRLLLWASQEQRFLGLVQHSPECKRIN